MNQQTLSDRDDHERRTLAAVEEYETSEKPVKAHIAKKHGISVGRLRSRLAGHQSHRKGAAGLKLLPVKSFEVTGTWPVDPSRVPQSQPSNSPGVSSPPPSSLVPDSQSSQESAGFRPSQSSQTSLRSSSIMLLRRLHTAEKQHGNLGETLQEVRRFIHLRQKVEQERDALLLENQQLQREREALRQAASVRRRAASPNRGGLQTAEDKENECKERAERTAKNKEKRAATKRKRGE